MKNVFKLVFFSVPIIIYASLIFLLDPFNYFNESELIPNNIKKSISPAINECLWKIVDYNRKPENSVLLGDSRMALANVDTLSFKYHKEFYNFSYASAHLNEMINTFWFISEKAKLDTVIFALSIEKYNQTFMRDRVKGAISVLSNPLLYFSNYNVPHASYLCLKQLGAQSAADLQRPPMTENAFWDYQIEVSGAKYYSSYKFSQFYYSELQKISTYCSENGIKLIFIIFPVHKDLQELVPKYNLEDDYKIFIRDISSFGDVLDLCFHNPVTNSRENFHDPFHIRAEVFNKYYLPIIFNGNTYKTDTLVRYYPGTN